MLGAFLNFELIYGTAVFVIALSPPLCIFLEKSLLLLPNVSYRAVICTQTAAIFFVHQTPAVLVVQANLMLFVCNSERSPGRLCDCFQPVTHMHSGNIQIGQPLQSAEYITKNR